MKTMLLICEDDCRSAAITRLMASEYNIWHVARLRDGMAWLKVHQPNAIVLDLDFLGQDVSVIINKPRSLDPGNQTMLIGLCKNPALIPHFLTEQLDHLTTLPSTGILEALGVDRVM